MGFPLLRASCLVAVVGSLALAGAACGGKTLDGGIGSSSGGVSSGGGGGGGSSSGGAGSSSGVGSSGGSSGGGGSSSSGSSGGSTSSSGGGTCPVQPGTGACSYGEQCSYGSGCDEIFCSCDASGSWECAGTACPPPECPPAIPGVGQSCDYEGQYCNYGMTGGGCGVSCSCGPGASFGDGGLEWSCYADPCPPPPACPTDPPQTGTACDYGASCYYSDDAGCGGIYCSCDPSGIWSCSIGDCIDAGPVDAGFQGSD